MSFKVELDKQDVEKFISLYGGLHDNSPIDESFGYQDERNIVIANLVGQLKDSCLNNINSEQIKPKRTSWWALTEKAQEHQNDFIIESEEEVPDCRCAYREIEVWLRPPSWGFDWPIHANDSMNHGHLINGLFELLGEQITQFDEAKFRFNIFLSSMSDKEYKQESLGGLLEVFFALCQECNN
jgi:hypothetical protein